ncbi:MAG: HEAT repeat domain-containing protein [Candidatus Heimdallarchaeota archaeon]|nr:HEAT repeat domain-containing protein [Candidatus Heimdallarchaeota archaeon]MCK5143303.1 HEAT repeat domain-containing protein [Candidatus Heimdallarchaeota archaeon]
MGKEVQFSSEEIEEIIQEAQVYIDRGAFIDWGLIEKLRKTGDKRAVTILNDLLSYCDDVKHTYLAIVIGILGKIGDESSIPLIVKYLHDPFGGNRYIAAESLRHFNDKSLAVLMIDTLKGVYNGTIKVETREPHQRDTSLMFETIEDIDADKAEEFLDECITKLKSPGDNTEIIRLLIDLGLEKVIKPVQDALLIYPNGQKKDYFEERLLELCVEMEFGIGLFNFEKNYALSQVEARDIPENVKEYIMRKFAKSEEEQI